MLNIKDKVVTVESLSTLHEHNKNTYMTKVNPTGAGAMIFDGSALFSGNVGVGSLTIGSNIKLISTEGSLEMVFLSETLGVKLLSSEGFILKDSNGLYLTLKEGE